MTAKRCWKLLKWLSLALACVGGASWVFMGVCSQPILPNLQAVEFPLGDLQSVAVDREGNIYCASTSYSRIQMYNRRGEFQRGWFVPSSGGMFWLDVDSRDRVEVWCIRGEKWLAFDQAGNQVVADPAALDASSPLRAANERRDVDGDTYAKPPYAIRGRWLNPRVVKIDANGAEHTVVRSPFYLWPLMGPVPAMLEVVVGMLLLGVSRLVLNQVYGPDSLRALAQRNRDGERRRQPEESESNTP